MVGPIRAHGKPRLRAWAVAQFRAAPGREVVSPAAIASAGNSGMMGARSAAAAGNREAGNGYRGAVG